MTISMYSASIPMFKQLLTSLANILAKAEKHAAEKKIEPNALLQARLYPDMWPLAKQVVVASDLAKNGAARLAGLEAPAFQSNEQDFATLNARLQAALAFIETLTPAQIDGSEEREIVLTFGEKSFHFKGQEYLVHNCIPQFVFHVTAAYSILRSNGLEIGKRDFLGPLL